MLLKDPQYSGIGDPSARTGMSLGREDLQYFIFSRVAHFSRAGEGLKENTS
jgi:hypothetical protein